MQRLEDGKKLLQAALKRLWHDMKHCAPAAAIFLLYAAAATLLLGTVCPFAAVTGLPCPGCGTTRALFLALTGRFGEAFLYQPFLFLWILLAVYAAWQRYIRGERAAGALPAATGIVVLMVCFYLYRMAVVFPADPPMNYREDNVLASLFPAYGELMKRLFSV